jgi:hypothetical protein
MEVFPADDVKAGVAGSHFYRLAAPSPAGQTEGDPSGCRERCGQHGP